MKKSTGLMILDFFLWRLGSFLIWPVAALLFPYQPSFAGPGYLEKLGAQPWFYAWANFDGVHYLTIASQGYLGTGLIQAFFPLYPLLIRGLGDVLNNQLLAGLVISGVSLLAALFLWQQLLKIDKLPIRLSRWLLLLFPTSVFLAVVYNESLFLALTLGCFFAIRKKSWWVAALLIGFASATRVVGIFLLPSLLWEWWQQNKPKIIDAKTLLTLSLLCILGASGLVIFMFNLYRYFGDALYFFHVQSEFGAGRQEMLIPYPQVIWRYIKILITARPIDFRYLIYIEELLAGVGGLILLITGFKRVRTSYLIFALPAFLLPTLTGTFSSMPRYLLICFPIYIVLAKVLQTRPKLRLLWFIFSTALLLINTMLFLRGFWVA